MTRFALIATVLFAVATCIPLALALTSAVF